MPRYPDIERLLCDWLLDVLPVGPEEDFRQVQPETPADLLTYPGMPCVVVERIPGGGDRVPGLDAARVSVDVFCTGGNTHEARAAAIARGEDIRRAIGLHIVGKTLGDGGPVVSWRRVIQEPVIRAYDSRDQIRRTHAIYAFGIHSPLTDD
jgi:hypothetical protein